MREKLYQDAITTWGACSQSDMAIEECSELIQALCHHKRGRVDNAEVIEEIADVLIMCEQLRLIYGAGSVDSVRAAKEQRLRERIMERVG